MAGQKQTGGMLPEHIGIIMDGNGRWAQKRGLPRSAGTQSRAPVPSGRSCGLLPEHRNPVSDSLCLFHRELEASPE